LADTKGMEGDGGHSPHRSADDHSTVVPALHKVLMATPMYRLFTSRVLAPWALHGIPPQGEVLEVGAGVGAMAAHLLDTTPGLRMVVTDYDPALVAIAERSLARFSERAVVSCVDACDLPFDDDRFDFVLSFAMFHHTGDWRRALGEVIRVLRPGGRLLGYDLLEGALLHRRRRPATMIRRGQLEVALGKLPVADARISPAFASWAVRFLAAKDSNASIAPRRTHMPVHSRSEESTDMADTKHPGGEDRPSKIHVTVIVQNRYTFDTEVVTGKQIKEKANISAGFSLHRRVNGGNEPIGDDESVELRNGDHLFARSPLERLMSEENSVPAPLSAWPRRDGPGVA